MVDLKSVLVARKMYGMRNAGLDKFLELMRDLVERIAR